MDPMSVETVRQVWLVTLAVYAVVLGVVATLLTLIVVAARKIHGGVSAIWVVGQKIANNTIHIALLDTTNHVVGNIIESAGGVLAATERIKNHAASCSGCPKCVLGGGW